jgi:hypothetical protein
MRRPSIYAVGSPSALSSAVLTELKHFGPAKRIVTRPLDAPAAAPLSANGDYGPLLLLETPIFPSVMRFSTS